MKRKPLTPIAAKKKLIQYHGYKQCDFYDEDLICKDSVMLSAKDVWEELELTRREQIEQENEMTW